MAATLGKRGSQADLLTQVGKNLSKERYTAKTTLQEGYLGTKKVEGSHWTEAVGVPTADQEHPMSDENTQQTRIAFHLLTDGIGRTGGRDPGMGFQSLKRCSSCQRVRARMKARVRVRVGILVK